MSSTTDPGNRSAADIEADVEQTRVRVAETIVALRESMSPGQIMDQVVDYTRSSGGAEFTRNLGVQVRDNPLPVMLIGAGIGWLLLSNGNKAAPAASSEPQRMLPAPTYGRNDGPGMMERAAQAGTHLRDGMHQTATGVGSAVGHAASGASNVAGQAVDAVSGAIGAVGQAASSVAGAVSGMASSAASAVGGARDTARAYGHDASHAAGQGFSAAAGTMNQMGQQASSMGDQLRQGWSRASTEQPMLMGALGLALGAVLGALLPRTQTEDRLIGETSDAVAAQLGAVAQEQYEQAKEVVSEHVADLRETVSGSGTSVSSLGDAVVDAAKSLGETVSQTTRDVTDRTKAGLDAKEETPDSKPAPTPASNPATTSTSTPAATPDKLATPAIVDPAVVTTTPRRSL
jgi:hypothetical protein